MQLPTDAIAPVLGYLGAAISGGTLWLVNQLPMAQIAGDAVKTYMEGGAYVALVGCLIYGNAALWRRLNKRDEDIAELNKEIRTDWKTQNDKLISVLEKLDPDK